MIRWRILFVFVSCLFIWCNEWSKINCNYQIYLRTFYANWDVLSTVDRLEIKERDEEKLPFSFFHTHSDFEWMYTKSLYFWTTMKWIIPCFFTLAFAFVEWLLLPFCFPQLDVKRSWIGYYYLALMLLVVLAFFISKYTSSEAIFAFTRKVWMILQSPSLFVLFFVFNLTRNDQHQQRHPGIS